jgi:hypothetical protein
MITIINVNFWDITPCSPLNVNGRFRGTHRLHLYVRGISRARNQLCLPTAFTLVSCSACHLLSRWFLAMLANCFHAGFLLCLPLAFTLVSCSACHLLSRWFLAPLATCFHAGFLLCLFFDPENAGGMFLRTVG